MTGVADSRAILGRVTHRSGSAASSRSNTVAAGASATPDPLSTGSCASALRQRHASSRVSKLSASIWSSGAYRVPWGSAAYERHSQSPPAGCAAAVTAARQADAASAPTRVFIGTKAPPSPSVASRRGAVTARARSHGQPERPTACRRRSRTDTVRNSDHWPADDHGKASPTTVQAGSTGGPTNGRIAGAPSPAPPLPRTGRRQLRRTEPERRSCRESPRRCGPRRIRRAPSDAASSRA